jgi:hypothetical protein
MKAIHFLFSGILPLLFLGCNNFKSTHPQAELTGEAGATGMTDKSILIFTTAIDRQLSNFKKEYSLIYLSGDVSLYAEKYSQYNNGMLYRTFTSRGNLSNVVKSYYFKNDSLVLVRERSGTTNDEGGQVLKDTRIYLRNNVAFKMENRIAGSPEAIRTLPYLAVQPPGNKYPDENYNEDIKVLNEAIAGEDKFEMVFQNIMTYPEASYIVLKSKKQQDYTATIRVNDHDTFIDSLLNMPAAFNGKKLNLNWRIADKEAVYVPVAETVTSAKGLNK